MCSGCLYVFRRLHICALVPGISIYTPPGYLLLSAVYTPMGYIASKNQRIVFQRLGLQLSYTINDPDMNIT